VEADEAGRAGDQDAHRRGSCAAPPALSSRAPGA
jgi:hypothetical protein